MEDQGLPVKEARKFADAHFAAALAAGKMDFQRELAEIYADHAARGLAISGAVSMATAQAHARRVDNLVQTKLDGLLEGYELHGVPLDDRLAYDVMEEVMRLQESLIADSQRALATSGFSDVVRRECKVSRPAVKVQLDRKRLAAKKESPVTNIIYNVHGHNPRWNTNSVDNSANTVSVTQEQIFSNLRQALSSGVPAGDEQKDILDRLSALEQAQNTPSFTKRYLELIAAAANHVSIIAPFIPALAELAQKWM